MYDINPFGNTDGAQSNPQDLVENFIDIIPRSAAVGGVGEEFISMRFIVGSKGSGKTHYMCVLRERVLEKNKSNYNSVFLSDIENSCDGTDLVIKFSQHYNSDILNEKWKLLWEKAIYCSVMSLFINVEELNERVSEDNLNLLKKYFEDLKLTYDCRMGVYNYFVQILYIYDTKNKVDEFLNHKVWFNVKELLIHKVLRISPPIYIFLDSIDDDYEHAPAYWQKCQKGLFIAVYKMLSVNIIREKLHIIVNIRDTVFASIKRSEHQTKIANESHILRLHWNKKSLSYFLDEKIRLLKECFFIGNFHNKNIQEWLGISQMHNKVRNCSEDVTNYIIRHTRCIPRDIINICNSLSKIKVLKLEQSNLDVEEEIRLRVSNCAKEIGDEMLAICAKQIVIDEMPKNSHSFSDVYTSVDEYTKSRYNMLRQVLKNLDTDTFKKDDLKKLVEESKKIFGRDIHILDILWLNGILGYVNNEQVYFYMNHNSISTCLDQNYDEYVLRSCMIDALDVKNLRSRPVI